MRSSFLLDNPRYILRKLAHTRTPELEHHPSSRQMLFFLVRYPLGLVLVSICDCRHFPKYPFLSAIQFDLPCYVLIW
jgi:hypothetical protein